MDMAKLERIVVPEETHQRRQDEPDQAHIGELTEPRQASPRRGPKQAMAPNMPAVTIKVSATGLSGIRKEDQTTRVTPLEAA